MKKTGLKLCLLFFAVAVLFTASTADAETKFRKDFRTSYEMNRFDALGFLVRTNKAILPAEITSLLDEAKAAESFDERMGLLDLANTMATMYKEWHGEGKYLIAVEKFQKEELAKEEARKAEIAKWNRYESFTGNIIMKSSMAQMEAKGLTPVLFPHWVHRLYYDCKACHNGLFTMKKGGNGLTKAQILEGKQCGVCHNGGESFDALKNCDRCHIVGKPGEDRLLSVKKADMNALKATAKRLGTGLNLDLMPKPGALPLDKIGGIDWMLMRKLKAHEPKKTIDKDFKEELRDNEILFLSPMPYVKNALFSHKAHTEQVACASCHQEIFKDEIGASKDTMADMAQGKACGACHGKVSFKFADCNRCHTKPIGEDVPGALKRTKQANQ